MKLDKEVYRYIEYELYHYEDYKDELELERERILEGSGNRLVGMPKRNERSDVTQAKAISLAESTAVLSLERRIKAVDKTLSRLTDLHKQLFVEVYCKSRKDVYGLCMELSISRETFSRYKRSIIYGVGNELGLIRVV